MDPDGAVTVDDTDPGIVKGLFPGFAPDPDPNLAEGADQYLDQVELYGGTVYIVSAPGYYVQYKFSGTYVAMYGAALPWIEGNLPMAHYVVDGESGQLLMSPNVSTPESNVLLYRVDNLSLGQHTLTVNVTTASSDNPWLFDFFRIASTPGSETQSTSSITTTDATTSTPASSSTPQLYSTQMSSSSSSTAVPTVAASRTNSSAFPTAPVVGAVAGGIVLISALLAFLYYLWRRARMRAQELDLEGVQGKQANSSPPVDDRRVAPENGAGDGDGVMGAADILPTLPPRTVPQAMYSPPVMQPLVTNPGPYPSWPRASTQQQKWAPYPVGGEQQLAMAPVMYAHPPYAPPGEQWPNYPANSGQSMRSSPILPMDQTSYFPPATLPRASTEAASIHSLVLSLETDAGDAPRSLFHGHPGHARAPSALSLAPSVLASAANSKTDLAIITPSGTPDGGARMLGGMVTYDGKESRLTTVASPDAVSPVDGEVGPGSHGLEGRHSMPPPAYVP